MHRRLMFTIFAPLLLATSVSASRRDDAARKIDAGLRELETKGFSGVILVHDRSGVIIRKAYGAASCDRSAPLTVDYRFDIGSITKIFTAAAVLRAQMDEAISLTTTLGEVFSEVPEDKRDITVMQLLEHRSGFPEAIGDDETLIKREFFIRKAWVAPLQNRPGEKFLYSNTGYSILAAILEMRTHRTYEQYLRERILAPAHAEGISYLARGKLACGFRDGLPWGSTADYFAAFGPSWYLVGNGALLATIDQLDRWFDALFAVKILDKGSTDLLVGRLTRKNEAGQDVFVIGGANQIFSSFYQRWLDSGVVLVLFTSSDEWPKEKVIPILREPLRALASGE